MGEIVYNALSSYYSTLEKLGYLPYKEAEKLLILSFYNDILYHHYTRVLSREYYRLVEEALECLYGTSCLIPYPDYLKMGKLHLGEMIELTSRLDVVEDRTSVIENTKVVKGKDKILEIDDIDTSGIDAFPEE